MTMTEGQRYKLAMKADMKMLREFFSGVPDEKILDLAIHKLASTMALVILEKDSGKLSVLGDSDGISFGIGIFHSSMEG